jgi:hypothetical protein
MLNLVLQCAHTTVYTHVFTMPFGLGWSCFVRNKKLRWGCTCGKIILTRIPMQPLRTKFSIEARGWQIAMTLQSAGREPRLNLVNYMYLRWWRTIRPFFVRCTGSYQQNVTEAISRKTHSGVPGRAKHCLEQAAR